MDTSSINDKIDAALAIETKEGHLANYLQDRAAERGLALGHKQRLEAIELFEGYVRSVPELLASASSSSAGTPVEESMGQIIRAAVAYWDEPDDLIPNELGLLGLLDDAYFTLRILQLVSGRMEAESGHVLVVDDLSALDAVVRDILGDLAEVLDQLVDLAMNDAPIDELIAKITEYSGSFILKSAQSSFAGMSIDALVETRLSFTAPPDDSLRDELIAAIESIVTSLTTPGQAAGAAPADELIVAGTRSLEQVLRRERDDYPFASEADIEALVTLMLGAAVLRVSTGRGRANAMDRAFIERCVDLVLDGAE